MPHSGNVSVSVNILAKAHTGNTGSDAPFLLVDCEFQKPTFACEIMTENLKE